MPGTVDHRRRADAPKNAPVGRLVQMLGEGPRLPSRPRPLVRDLSSAEICRLYEVNRAVIDRSLKILRNNPERNGIAQFPQIWPAKGDGPPPEILSPAKLVRMTGDLFLHIANQSGSSDFIRRTLNANQQLRYVRLCECALIDFPEEELAYLCHLYRRNHIKELRHAVAEYHVTRFKIIPRLMKIL